MFIYALLVRPLTGYSMMAGGVALGLIMLPIVARTSEEALRAIPRSVDEAGLALGLPRRRVVARIDQTVLNHCSFQSRCFFFYPYKCK